MTIDDYFHQIEIAITAAHTVHISTVTYDKRSAYVGFLRGTLFFLDGSRLHIREFVNVEHAINRYMYVYHYQKANGKLVFRYDNTPHHPNIPSFPHHKHIGSESIQPTPVPDLDLALRDIYQYLLSSQVA